MPSPIIPPQVDKNKEARQRANWTMSYRLQGMSIGLIVAAIYCYTHLHSWPAILIISAGILGYALGWVVGYFLYNRR